MSAISASSVDPFALPSLPLVDRRHLPDCSAVYFALSSNGEVLYIGRSINMRARWISHHRFHQLEQLQDVRLAWLQVSEPSMLPAIEAALIEHFDPVLNLAPSLGRFSESAPTHKIKIMLKELRTARGLSQNGLAQATGMTLQNVQKIEYGKAKSIPLDTLDKLCAVLNCDVGDLLVRVPDVETATDECDRTLTLQGTP